MRQLDGPASDAQGATTVQPDPSSIGVDAEFAPIARRPRPDDHVAPAPEPAPEPSEKPLTRTSSGPAYSVFTRGTRRWMVAMATAASFVSPMTATIYYPALDALSLELRVSIAMINFTITSYMILQALAPTFYGDLGDMTGRRPALMLAVGIYACANVGLALQRNYIALLVLRMVQSAGGSGTIPLGMAIVADITTSAERGKYMGVLGCGINVGPTLGPVLGGILSEFLGWPAIFWFCAILGALWLLVFCLTVPETCRKVVGNGSIPAQSWNRPLVGLFRKDVAGSAGEDAPSRTKLRFPNPLRAVRIVFEKEMSLVLLYNSILYVDFVLVAATLAPIFKETYGFSVLELGLCYLPYGAGCCIASVGQGYLLDWNYARIARKIGFAIDRRRGDDLLHFPIERARLQPVYPALVVGVLTMAAYGWTLQMKTSVAVPLVLQFVVGMCITGSFSIISTLVVDLNPKSPATATAANNLVRCMMGAVATAVIDYMISGLGQGWSFTVVAALPVVLSPMLWAIETRGPRWRKEQRAEEERQQATAAVA